MPDVNALYPQPPAAPSANQGLLTGDPSKIVGMVGQLNQNALFQQTYNARQKIGEAYKGAIGPDGTVDHSALMRGAGDAGFLAPDAVTAAQSQQTQRIQNTSTQFQQAAGLFGALADVDKPTSDMVHQITATLAATMPDLTPTMKNNLATSVLKDPLGIKHGAAMLRNMAIGPAGTSTRVVAPPSGTGAPQQGTLGAANLAGSTPTGLPPGGGQYLESSAKAGTDLEATARTYPQDVADLQNLVQEGKVLSNKTGPTFEAEKKVNTILNRFGIPGTMSKEELAAGDSFDKIAKQITTNQAVMLGGGTDAGRAMILGATPNTGMSQYGIEGVGQMMLGNRDAINVARQEWIKAKKAQGLPQNAHLNWLDDFTAKGFDPRVFQFNRMSRENQQKFLHQIDPSEIGDFEKHYNSAIANKWVKPLKGASGG